MQVSYKSKARITVTMIRIRGNVHYFKLLLLLTWFSSVPQLPYFSSPLPLAILLLFVVQNNFSSSRLNLLLDVSREE